MANADLSADRVREILNYDADTGVFTYKIDRRNGSKAGDVAGWITKPVAGHKPRRVIEIDQMNYKAHRLAWLYVHGEWPIGVIDHRNGDALDNSIANLRDTTQTVNLQNRHAANSNSSSKLLGAYWNKGRNVWKSQIKAGGKLRFLGTFDTAEDAHMAYLSAKRRLHEGCTI